MKSIGVTGAGGRLGSYLLKTYPEYVALDCDVTNPEDVDNCIGKSKVNLILHLAAKSDVDWCEKPENQKRVDLTNLWGVGYVSHSAQIRQIPVVFLSSDHVFGGQWGLYREKDKINPINYYGFSKAGAESLIKSFDNLKVIRTSFLFTRERLNKELSDLYDNVFGLYPTFIIRTFMYLPYFTLSLNHYISEFEKMPKILHISGNKSASWYELMRDIAKKVGLNHKKLIVPRTTPSQIQVPRPYWGGLNVNLSRKLGFKQYSYLDGIDQMLKDWK